MMVKKPLPPKDRASGSPATATNPASERMTLPQGLGWTVAAVDGDPGISSLYHSLARRAGADRFWSLNRGDLALEKLASDPPDVLLMELILPRVDGLSLLEKLAETGALRHTRVIVLSSCRLLPELKDTLQRLGVDLVVGKPFEPFRLVTHLLSLRMAFEAAFERARLQLEEAQRLGQTHAAHEVLGETAGTVAQLSGVSLNPIGTPRRPTQLPFVVM